MKCDRKNLLLYAVTDRFWTGEKTLKEQVEESLQGGATMLQLREKELNEEMFLKEAMDFKELCSKYQVPFIINDNVEVALKCDADGIHVGQNDMEAGMARERIGADKILGVSVQTVDQAILAEQRGADYLGVGSIFPTSTKQDAQAVSVETLKDICQAVSIPVVAIGGITLENVSQLEGTEIAGIAVVSAIFGAIHIEEATEKLRKKVEHMIGDTNR